VNNETLKLENERRNGYLERLGGDHDGMIELQRIASAKTSPTPT